MKCIKCGKDLSDENIYRHYRDMHLYEKVKCPFCPLELKNVRGLKMHLIENLDIKRSDKKNAPVVKTNDVIELLFWPDRFNTVIKRIKRRIKWREK